MAQKGRCGTGDHHGIREDLDETKGSIESVTHETALNDEMSEIEGMEEEVVESEAEVEMKCRLIEISRTGSDRGDEVASQRVISGHIKARDGGMHYRRVLKRYLRGVLSIRLSF